MAEQGVWRDDFILCVEATFTKIMVLYRRGTIIATICRRIRFHGERRGGPTGDHNVMFNFILSAMLSTWSEIVRQQTVNILIPMHRRTEGIPLSTTSRLHIIPDVI